MCGIAGYIAAAGAHPNHQTLITMCDRIVHRGPDDYGEFLDRRAALGHRRLSIIDLAGGHQPIGNEDGSVQAIFNGEIYNYQSLRRDLLAKGHRLATNSDTEVLVHLYEEVGERLPEYLNGMFAFAIWDARREELFLARDRLGKKPLYYSESIPGARLAFASELKALAAMPGFDRPVNERAVADFLALGYVPDPDTIYRGVEKLAPGHSLLLAAGGAKLRRYWSLQFAPDSEAGYQAKLEQLHSLVVDSVVSRLMSEVPLGAFLSGGLDSSTVVAVMAKHAPGQVKSFSIGFTNQAFDELDYARLLAARYRTEHHEEVVTPSIHEMLDTLVDQFDEPFGDPSAIPTLYLCRMTRRHVTVALSGDGGDELFGGYDRYALGLLEDRLRRMLPAPFRRTALRTAAAFWPKLDFLPRPLRWKSMMTCVSQELSDGYFTSVSAIRDGDLQSLLSPALRRALGGYNPRDRFREHFQGLEHLSPLEQMQAVDIKTYLPGDILVKVDRASMAYSLETRAPLLDYRIAELAATLPPAFKLKRGSGKRIFKQAFAGDLPQAITQRRKMGFSVPLAEWFRTSLKPLFESTVLRPDMERYLSLDRARQDWERHQRGLRDHSTRLWYMLMLACWDSRHNTPRQSAPLAEFASRISPQL